LAFETKVLLTAFAQLLVDEAAISGEKVAEKSMNNVYKAVQRMANCEGVILPPFNEVLEERKQK
jgi:hypothetical protein